VVEDGGSLSLDGRLLETRVARGLFAVDQPVVLGRYRLLRRLGEGGMGIVFEAVDGRNGQRLALKVLHAHGLGALAELKREFRVLADLHHHNLVQLHELSVDGEQPFIAMELIDGQSPFEYVRLERRFALDRARQLIRQLVEAVSFLHAQGVVHRDLKPSNLLVQPDGRLVVLDFGLAVTLGHKAASSLSGTPRYMAPERARGVAADHACDWFSVGVIMAELLSDGRCAAPPDAAAMLRAAESFEPERGALARLSAQLLAPDPAQRPTGSQLRAQLGLSPWVPAMRPPRAIDDQALFVGRSDELRRLSLAFERARAGAGGLVLLHGEAGIGKTALVRSFLGQLEATHAARVVSGRCYEGELIPYNAIDGAMEPLAQVLRDLARDARERIRPEGMRELLLLFPALGDAFELEPESARPAIAAAVDMRHVRGRGFAALRELLHRLAEVQPLVMHLDDLQWGDADSAALLLELLAPPAPAGLLVLASFRTADADHSPCVHALRESHARGQHPLEQLQVGALDPSAGLELARALGGSRFDEQELSQLSREAGGSPLFLRALVNAQQHAAGAAVDLPALFEHALCALSPAARQLLELVALCGRPIERELLLHAAQGTGQTGTLQHLTALKQTGLLRSVPSAQHALECFHDRVREIVTATLPPARKAQQHAVLAEAAARGPEPDGEFLAHHFHGAGQLEHAAHHAELAGDRSLSAIALENAVRHYAMALSCLPGRRSPALVEKLGNAISATGRCAEAAPLFLEAAALHSALQQTQGQEAASKSLRLQRRAAQMWIQSGRMDQANAVIDPLLRVVGVRRPRTKLGILIAAHLAVFRLRLGRQLKRTPPRALDASERLRNELCFTLGQALTLADRPLAAALILRMLPSALRDPASDHRAGALASYATMMVMLGHGSQQHQDELFDRALELAHAYGDPETLAWVLFQRAVSENHRSRFACCLLWAEQISHAIDRRLIDSGWVRDELVHGKCSQLVLTGRLSEIGAIAPAAMERAARPGNALQRSMVHLHYCFFRLARDETDQVDATLREASQSMASDDVYAFDAFVVWTRAHHRLYAGQSQLARDELETYWPRFVRAGHAHFQPWAIALLLLRATVTLAHASQEGSRASLRTVRSCIARLRRFRQVFALPARLVSEAGLAHLEGKRVLARDRYREAADAFEALSMAGYAAAARAREAELSGEHGPAVRARAEAWFGRERVANPARWIRMYCPIGD
jgi:hypothetical protein